MKKSTKESVIQIIKDQINKTVWTISNLDKKEYLTKRMEDLKNEEKKSGLTQSNKSHLKLQQSIT